MYVIIIMPINKYLKMNITFVATCTYKQWDEHEHIDNYRIVK